MKHGKKQKGKKEFLWSFLKDCKPGKLDRQEFAELIESNQKLIIDYISKRGGLYGVNDNVKEALDELYSKMAKAAFPKALKYILKSDVLALDIRFVLPIANFMEHVKPEDQESNKSDDDSDYIAIIDEDIMDRYVSIINKLLKSRVKEISKKVDMDDDLLTEFLVVLPDKDIVSENDAKYIGYYVYKMLKKIYLLADIKDWQFDNTKQIKKLFGELFGKKFVDVVAVHVLLEKKDFIKKLNEKQQVVWNMLTTFALETIEKQEKKHIKELLEYYCAKRAQDEKRQRDGARRIQFSAFSPEEYPTLSKVAKKMSENQKYKKYL